MSIAVAYNFKFLVSLANFQKFGPVRLKKIKKHFKNYYDAFHSNVEEYIKAGIEENIAKEFIVARTKIHPDQLMEQLEKENISIMAVDHSDFPKLLSEIYDPPQLLYYRGIIKKDEFALAIVGSRKITSYGERVVEKFVSGIAENKITVVSGLALGVDSLAHNITIKNGGRTVAVIGSGLDKQSIYPTQNRYLADKIVDSGGAVISEFPLGTPPLRHHFPQRNRIISGLSLGTIVIEAGEKSGALITASCAMEQGREVFAVPGNIFSPVSQGPNNLIKQGAKPVTTIDDVFEFMDLKQINNFIKNREIVPETDEEKIIITNLNHEPTFINDLVRVTGLDINRINSTLTIMEMKGMVKNVGNMQYVLNK
jgi:DNA processing protein